MHTLVFWMEGFMWGHTGALLTLSVSQATWIHFLWHAGWVQLPLGNLATAAPVQTPQLSFKFPVSFGRNLFIFQRGGLCLLTQSFFAWLTHPYHTVTWLLPDWDGFCVGNSGYSVLSSLPMMFYSLPMGTSPGMRSQSMHGGFCFVLICCPSLLEEYQNVGHPHSESSPIEFLLFVWRNQI